MNTRFLALLLLIVLCLSLAACGGTSPAPATSPIAWMIEPVSSPSANPQILRVISMDGTEIPARASKNALDLLIMGSQPDYGGLALDQFYADIKPFLRDVFGGSSAIGGTGYSTPFNYYVTDYEYGGATPTGSTCNPGLPPNWAPAQNTAVSDLPAWDCNIALSTASVSLNLGLIIHRRNLQDKSKYNLFSSEFNSYAAILHELSHAAFVMSDEANAPSAGRFATKHYPNIYNHLNSQSPSTCNGICPGKCSQIGTTVNYRCQPTSDKTNLMHFQPQPTPGVNTGWDSYGYEFDSVNRLQYIYDLCTAGEC